MSRHPPAQSRLGACLYTPDVTVPPDRDGRRYCTCGAPQDHVRHTLPAPDPEVQRITARIAGDKD